MGLVTLDFVYLTAGLVGNNQKVVAVDYTVAAGGPGTNAAVAFSYLGGEAILLGGVGCHPINHLINSDLARYKVGLVDLDSSRLEPPSVSSIIVTQNTGDRAVVSINATKSQATIKAIPPDILDGVEVVLIDGHQMEVGYAIAQIAKSHNIPVVIDGGSWKSGFERVLPLVDYAICSANFYPPNCHSKAEVFSYLSLVGIPHIAISGGEKPIEYLSNGQAGCIEVPEIKPVDTLGAGDIFHGAFCYYILQTNFLSALASAAKIASYSCQFFGTRRWMEDLQPNMI